MRDPLLPFYFQKAPVLKVFTQFFSLLLSESNGVYMRGVKLFVCLVGGGERETQREELTLLDLLNLDKWVTRQREETGHDTKSPETFSLHFWPKNLGSYNIGSIYITTNSQSALSDGVTTNYNSTGSIHDLRDVKCMFNNSASDLDLISAY